ncbi:MAG: outer membrane beta-barrel domain-containing protein [Bdellovibrionales bacterium]|nr:outer membrane beta-barrel domain-containing protein [Bdellovibrionales bacterium]
MNKVIILLSLLFSSFIANGDILKDFDSLGKNKVLLENAQALFPEKKIEIVQERIVDRNWRHEFSPDYEVVSNGDNPYFHSQKLGFNYQLHINPYWSVGLKYQYNFNWLTEEGDRIIEDGRAKQDAIYRDDPNSREKPDPFIPELNWAQENYLAFVNWYPIYGKFKFLNSGIVHFDLYTHLAAGQIKLRYNNSDLYQFGIGTGLWWSQHITSRIEYKFSTYKTELYKDQSSIQTGNLSLSVGYLL